MLPKTPSSLICTETLFLTRVCFQVCEQAEYKNLNKHFHTNVILLWTPRLWEWGSMRNVNRVIFLDVKLFCFGHMLPHYVHMVQHKVLVPKFISYHSASPLPLCLLAVQRFENLQAQSGSAHLSYWTENSFYGELNVWYLCMKTG